MALDHLIGERLGDVGEIERAELLGRRRADHDGRGNACDNCTGTRNPLQTDADTREVQSMLRALVTGKVLRTVEEKPAALAPFGLEQPITTITVSAAMSRMPRL